MITNLKERPGILSNKGVTLIELIIVLITIGILSSIAYPTYIKHINTAHRGDAQGDLIKISNNLERYFTESNTYAGAAIGANIASDHYDYTLAALATTYKITATPTGNQSDDICGIMTLTQSGAMTPTTNNCWR